MVRVKFSIVDDVPGLENIGEIGVDTVLGVGLEYEVVSVNLFTRILKIDIEKERSRIQALVPVQGQYTT